MSQRKKNWGPPLTTVNRNYYNPMIHTPPSGLENNLTLTTPGPKPMYYLNVTQPPPNQVYKPGPNFNDDSSYGQYVEMGGRKKTKRRKQKKRKAQKTKKKRRTKTMLRKKNKK